jgi:hypothetical protein
VLLHCGDLTDIGGTEAFERQIAWLLSVQVQRSAASRSRWRRQLSAAPTQDHHRRQSRPRRRQQHRVV